MTARAEQGVLWHHGKFDALREGLRIRTGRPSLSEWSSAIRAIVHVKSGVQWAIGDLLLYADERDFNADAVEEVLDATGMKRATLMNHKTVAKSFPLPRRRREVPWSHHALVTSLTSEEADALLLQAIENKWGWEELRAHARETRLARRRLLRDCPPGRYAVLYATPPLPRPGDQRVAMSADQLLALSGQVNAVTAEDAILYMQVPSQYLAAGLQVLGGWGFRYAGSHICINPTAVAETPFMRLRHEILLVGVRGDVVEPGGLKPDSVQEMLLDGPRIAEMLSETWPESTRVHMFARGETAHDGFVQWSYVEDEVGQRRRQRAVHLPDEAAETEEREAVSA